MENILIVDTETTGLDPFKGSKIIEIAVILFSVKYKTILQQYSTLLPCEENPVENINHIKVEHTKANYSLALIDSILMGISDCADACVAHNAEFDKKFVALLGCGTHLLNKKWVCTKQNFTWPIALPRFRLEDICTAMRVPYVNAHRALNDCALLAQCFQNVEDLQDRFDRLR